MMSQHGANCLCQFCRYSQSIQQQAQAGLLHVQQQATANNWHGLRDMTSSDLGIVDQLLDDKVGMEP